MELKEIEHINYVRIGTRTPVVYPMRFFDKELMKYLKEFNKVKTLYPNIAPATDAKEQ